MGAALERRTVLEAELTELNKARDGELLHERERAAAFNVSCLTYSITHPFCAVQTQAKEHKRLKGIQTPQRKQTRNCDSTFGQSDGRGKHTGMHNPGSLAWDVDISLVRRAFLVKSMPTSAHTQLNSVFPYFADRFKKRLSVNFFVFFHGFEFMAGSVVASA